MGHPRTKPRPREIWADQTVALLTLPFRAARDQWQALQEQSTRCNIGAIRRTRDIPTLVLLIVRADNQHRFLSNPTSCGPIVALLITSLPVENARPLFSL